MVGSLYTSIQSRRGGTTFGKFCRTGKTSFGWVKLRMSTRTGWVRGWARRRVILVVDCSSLMWVSALFFLLLRENRWSWRWIALVGRSRSVRVRIMACSMDGRSSKLATHGRGTFRNLSQLFHFLQLLLTLILTPRTLPEQIDIIEGVHTTTQNTQSFHTGPNCTMQKDGFSNTFTSSSPLFPLCLRAMRLISSPRWNSDIRSRQPQVHLRCLRSG